MTGAAAPTVPAPDATFVDGAALDGLQAEATGAAVTAAPGAPAAPTAEQFKGDAAMLVAMSLGMLSKGIHMTKGVTVSFDKGVAEEGAERLAPLLAKYDGKMPPWVAKWKEEFAAGVWVGGVAFHVYQQVQAAAPKAPAHAQA